MVPLTVETNVGSREATAFRVRDDDWTMLVKSIRKSECVLLLGPGASLDPDQPDRPALPVQLAQEMARELHESRHDELLAADSDLAHVAQVYSRMMPRGRVGLEAKVDGFFQRFQGRTTSLHNDLAALPFSLCITTVPDGFALNAFRQAEGKQPVADYYDFQPDPERARERRAAPSPPEREPYRQPLVYELFGTLAETGSLVLTEDNLLDFLVKVTRGTPRLHDYLTARFKNKRTSFLFIGFGFRQWYWRLLLHVLEASGHTAFSLALEDSSFFCLPDYRQTAVFFQSGHTIEFREVSWPDFARELRQRVGWTAGSGVAPGELQPAPEGPTVFLCHENRDKPAAERMAEELRARGINVWLDKHCLRGGDLWPQIIPRVIEKQTDYVLVLQSSHMLDKPESYFHLEIRTALKRQDLFGDGFRFLVPLILNPDPRLPLESVAGLHCIDWQNGQGLPALQQTILDDWEKRRRVRARTAGP